MSEQHYRTKCLSAYGSECSACGTAEGEIVAHHINGDRSDNEINNLVPLCRSCHSKVHLGRELTGLLDELQQQLPEDALGFDPDYTPVKRDDVSIILDKATRTRLRTWKSKRDQTYDEAINDLLDRVEGDAEV